MAADRPLTERGFVEVKMGRSKFPGKPSKIGNRKRVNLSSCALPEDNDSSKAAKNIYLGLSVFNETFGDNEMVAPRPFHGFSLSEVEEAMAEARLQQNEAELEHKKQGINVNLWDSFQNELFSIKSCTSYYKTNINPINKAKFSFDGGGSAFNEDSNQMSTENNEKQPFSAFEFRNSVLKNHKAAKNSSKLKSNLTSSPKKASKVVKFLNARLMLAKLPHCSGSSKSLQSQAAKRLLNKAKMSNTLESSKSNSVEKKFILPNYSIHSSRVIKPNKKFLEESTSRRKLLRRRAKSGVSEFKHSEMNVGGELKLEKSDKKQTEEIKSEVISEELHKKNKKTENNLSENKVSEVPKGSSPGCNSGKIILREARLQLDNSNSSLLEGPFSSPSASSLGPNSHLKINSAQIVSAPGNVVCGVCGIVKFYKYVDLAKKFGIYCCESCRKFITKYIKSLSLEKTSRLQCIKGKGLCAMVPIVKSQNLNAGLCYKNNKCQACWLKLCLKNFKIPTKLKQKLMRLLPVNMQLGVSLELSSISSKDINKKFLMNKGNIKDFKWLKENCTNLTQVKFASQDKQPQWTNPAESVLPNEKSLRKRNRGVNENVSKPLIPKMKNKAEFDEKSRQTVVLKGPRVKHVCRSASVVLGQPLATFPSEASSTKKHANEPVDDCKNCDNLMTTNITVETQGVEEKPNAGILPTDVKEEKKSQILRPVANSKVTNVNQQSIGTKSKKKSNVKTENPVSMDFWESYDPDEVCEMGFGLIGSKSFSVRALCFLCGSSGQEKLIHCASCCEPYHEFCVNEGQLKLQDGQWKYDWVCPRCTVCATCGKTSGQQLKCIKCDNSYHTECVDRVGGRLLYSPDRPWVCSICLRCKSCNGIDVSVFVGNLPLCKGCFILRQKGNYCPLCQRCYEDDDYDSKMMECGQCKCWVHAKCEGLSDEKYQVLSFLPESVEYVCRMCCVIPPAPWWVAVEAELKSGYLGVLKALSKNRKACTMLKWSPRKQCTCRQASSVLRNTEIEDFKSGKNVKDCNKNENSSASGKEENKLNQDSFSDKGNNEKYQPGNILERKASIEVINHPTESLKLTLKIMKGSEADAKEKSESFPITEETPQVKQINKDSIVRVKCLSSEESSEDSLINTFDCQEEGLHSFFKANEFGGPSELPDKRLLSSPLNPPSDSGIGSTDDELKASCLTDEESCKLEDQQLNSNRIVGTKSNCDSSATFMEERRDCFCFLEVDSYNSRSKPFSPNLMSIKKKVTTSEYTSLHQFHQDMQGMIATTQSVELMDLYHQTIKEIFPWFDPKYSRVQSNSQKVSGTMSLESTPVKSTPTKSALLEECKVPMDKLSNQCLDYFYSDHVVEDNRICLMCKAVGDGPPGDTGRLLYCGQNEWVHCNCALWSGEVFEEIDGSLQNVHSAISRGRSIRCPECSLKGASIGCCARNCQETYHFHCAREVGCVFMDDKTVYCPAHLKESSGKLVQNEKEFEIRRPVYVELDKRKMKAVDSSQVRFTVGALHVNNLGKFILKLSDQSEAIIPENFDCTRLFWSCFEPWRVVRYHFTVRLLDVDDDEGVDCGVNLTIDHSKEPEIVELKLKQLQYFQANNTLLDFGEKLEETIRDQCKFSDFRTTEEIFKSKHDEGVKPNLSKRAKKDQKAVKKIFDQFDSKDDENCLSDNQNTAGLLPPDIEEAIFKDLPNDILDGISMQDIFMDIKNDSYDNNVKEGISEFTDAEDISENLPVKSKKQDYHSDTSSQLDFWIDTSDYRQEMTEELLPKSTRDAKKVKNEVGSNLQLKRNATLRTYQKSCAYNWNCKAEAASNKWKKSSKCHVTVNFLESQDRGNMLQELKFTDGLVSVSTGTIDSVKDLKARLEDKCSIQQEEGKENKCLPWQTRLQPRLLQVDGGVDSSSSGSEAGESPQRVIDESLSSKIVPVPQSSPFLDSLDYSLNGSLHSESTKENFSSDFCGVNQDQISKTLIDSLPQLDGVTDFYSEGSDSEDYYYRESLRRKRPRREGATKRNIILKKLNFKINQCDGGIDSESDEGETKTLVIDEVPCSQNTTQTVEKPVKCKRCHCTYRTQNSYQRHLEMCRSDFILSSSEGEMSEEESSKTQSGSNCSSPVSEMEESLLPKTEESSTIKEEINNVPLGTTSPTSIDQSSEDQEKLEVKKDNAVKKTYARKKPVQNAKKIAAGNSVPQTQQIIVQQPNSTPALLVQDVPGPNLMTSNYTDVGPAINYMTAVESQNTFGKPQLIATPNGILSGGFQFPSAPDTQIVGGLCLNAQNVQPNIPGFIIQQPQPIGPVIPQPGPVLMPNEQMMLGHPGLYDVIQDPGTGEMFLARRSQPFFYNMETVVSNTVMQTNQFVSNVFATSFSQTSTQIFQAREMEHLVNIPSNYIVVAPSPPTADKILPSEALICVQTPQTLIPNQTSIQIPGQPVFNASFQTSPTLHAEPKIISTPLNPIRCVQPLQVKQFCPPILVSKLANASTSVVNPPATQIFRAPATNSGPHFRNAEIKVKPMITAATNPVKNMPMAKSTLSKSLRKSYEKSGATAKFKSQAQQNPGKASVDYLDNFRSDSSDSLKECSSLNQKNYFLCQAASVKQEQLKIPAVSVNSVGDADSITSKPSSEIVPSNTLNHSSDFYGASPPSKISIESKEKSPVKSCNNAAPVFRTLASLSAMPGKDEEDLHVVSLDQTKCSSKIQNSVNIDSQKSKPLENISTSKKSELAVLESNKSDKIGAPNVTLASALTNISNSFSFDQESNSGASLPSLEDSPPSCSEEPEKVIPDRSPTSERQIIEILPLQDNSQALNTGCKISSKSPIHISPVKTKTPSSDEKTKLKKKSMTSDQNSLDSDFLPENLNEVKGEKTSKRLSSKRYLFQNKCEEKGPKLIFDVISDDGFKSSSTSMVELWANICDSVQEMRAVLKIPPLPVSRKGYEILGMQNHGLQHCLEQLKGVEQCVKYKCKYFIKEVQKSDEDESLTEQENFSGSARTEKFTCRKEYDMFAWLASKHRQLPKLTESAEETLSSIRRANSLPMAMRYRNLKETAKLYVGVYRSKIHGRGLFCLREIEAGEMVIEYAGEVIRSNLTDKREKYYTEKGIGCYMFRIDDHFVVDATMKGNAARFINHSCEPNCYSRVIDILGKKHIVIFALRRINVMEELTYDYKFPFEDEKISCHCLSKKCRKYLN